MAISKKIVNRYGDSQFLAGVVLANGSGLDSKFVTLSDNEDGTFDATAAVSVVANTNYYVLIKEAEQNIIADADYPQSISDNDKVIAVQAGQMTATFPAEHGLSVEDSVELDATNIFKKYSSGTKVGVVRKVDGNVVTIDFDLRLF